MLLDLRQRKTLTLLLTRRFPQIADLELFLLDKLGKNLDELGIGALGQLRQAVIRDAEANEWTIELLDALRENAGPDAKKLLDEIGTNEVVREARFHDECYVDRYPLVNRTDLRGKLRAATSLKSKRILLVKGDRYSGKSHTLTHLRHVARSLEVPLAEIPLLRYATGKEVQPEDFGPPIASALKVPLPEQLDKKPARWSVNFLDWLAGQLGPRQPLWVAIDDFEPEKIKVPLSQPVEELITMLAESVAERMTSTRLFLINYDKDLSSKVKPHLERETVPAITDSDLIDFFLLFYRDHMPSPDDDDAIAADAARRVARVLGKISNDAATRLLEMRDALIEECQEMAP